jgi:hypothetical protein
MPSAQDPVDVLVSQFLETPEGVALNTAFVRINDPNIRRYIIDLATESTRGDVASSPARQDDLGAMSAP